MPKPLISVSDVVRKNLTLLIKRMGLNQYKMGDAIGKDRSQISKKIKGQTPITLKQIDQILAAYPFITLDDLLDGYPLKGTYSKIAAGFSAEAMERFPFLGTIIANANSAAESDQDEADLELLRGSLKYGLAKIPDAESSGLHLETGRELQPKAQTVKKKK